jgi:PTS system mannose-specific IIB component
VNNPFFRVDNRLIHGQVIATWMPHLRLQRYLIASDSVPNNPLQMTMFRMAIPAALSFDALPVEQAAAWLARKSYGKDRTMVLFETLEDALRLFARCPFPMLNIGNVHHAPGRKPFTDAVYLGEPELKSIGRMADRGVQVEIRSLPHEAPLSLSAR